MTCPVNLSRSLIAITLSALLSAPALSHALPAVQRGLVELPAVQSGGWLDLALARLRAVIGS